MLEEALACSLKICTLLCSSSPTQCTHRVMLFQMSWNVCEPAIFTFISSDATHRCWMYLQSEDRWRNRRQVIVMERTEDKLQIFGWDVNSSKLCNKLKDVTKPGEVTAWIILSHEMQNTEVFWFKDKALSGKMRGIHIFSGYKLQYQDEFSLLTVNHQCLPAPSFLQMIG